MRTPLDPRHTPVGLTVASPSEPAPEEHSRFPAVPWLLAAVAWTAAVALVGWVLVGALVSVSWLTAVHVPAAEVFGTIGQGWLVLHGVPGGLAGATVRLVPLGATQLLALGCGFAAHHAAAQVGEGLLEVGQAIRIDVAHDMGVAAILQVHIRGSKIPH